MKEHTCTINENHFVLSDSNTQSRFLEYWWWCFPQDLHSPYFVHKSISIFTAFSLLQAESKAAPPQWVPSWQCTRINSIHPLASYTFQHKDGEGITMESPRPPSATPEAQNSAMAGPDNRTVQGSHGGLDVRWKRPPEVEGTRLVHTLAPLSRRILRSVLCRKNNPSLDLPGAIVGGYVSISPFMLTVRSAALFYGNFLIVWQSLLYIDRFPLW